MQIKKLQIDSYRHLKNLNFDFTYPKGHQKAGKPLEKICLIGQSATGKTTVLELIKNNLSSSKLKPLRIISKKYLDQPLKLSFTGKFILSFVNNTYELANDEVSVNNQPCVFHGAASGTVENFIDEDLKMLYLSSDIISKESINIFNQNPLHFLNSGLQQIQNEVNYIYEFIQEINIQVWFSLLFKILDYRKKFTQMASEVINKGAIADINRLNKQFIKWSETNENPLLPFANAFNPILKKLNLEVDLINTEYPIPLKSKIKDDVIPVSSLSTGTKGLLLSMFPLYELNTNDAMILIDEPERSLFPDMQIDLISHYQRLAPEAQIIVATHSPFIAAAFEPEERFILYFDDKGEVLIRRGESPIGDDPNDILRSDFNVDYYNEFGKQAYKDYINLKTKVSQEQEPETKKKLIVEMAELGDKYNF